MQIRFLAPFGGGLRLPWTGAASGDWGHLWGLGPPPGTGAASGDWGRLWGLEQPLGTGAASGDLGRLRGLALPPGTRAASSDWSRLRGFWQFIDGLIFVSSYRLSFHEDAWLLGL